jgi:hypothetical protein
VRTRIRHRSISLPPSPPRAHARATPRTVCENVDLDTEQRGLEEEEKWPLGGAAARQQTRQPAPQHGRCRLDSVGASRTRWRLAWKGGWGWWKVRWAAATRRRCGDGDSHARGPQTLVACSPCTSFSTTAFSLESTLRTRCRFPVTRRALRRARRPRRRATALTNARTRARLADRDPWLPPHRRRLCGRLCLAPRRARALAAASLCAAAHAPAVSARAQSRAP